VIRSLVAKEARLQAPFLVLVFLFAAIGAAELALSESFETLGGERLMDFIVSDEHSEAVAQFLLAFSLAIGLLVREIDERTQELIDALPVSRARVFVVKVSFAIGVLAILPLSGAILTAWAFELSASSLRQGVPWDHLAGGVMISVTQIVASFSLGLLLSFVRPYSWICFGLLFWVQQLAELVAPSAALVDPFRIGSDFLRTTPVRWPWQHAIVLWGISLACLSLAFITYVRGEDRSAAEVSGEPGALRRWVRRAVGPVTVALVIATLTWVMRKEVRETPGKVSGPKGSIAHATTEHYEMTYPGTLADRARVLLVRADEVHDVVAEALGVVESATIAIDATGSRQGTAGITTWTKVRIDLSSADDPEELAAVLGHETAHVYISRLSRQAVDQDPSSRFFHEGLASLIEYSHFHTERELAILQIMAAAADERFQLPFSKLLDESALNEELGTELTYLLGERFFSTLVERHGFEAVRALLTELGDPSFPRQAEKMDRWRIAFQKAGLDLEAEIAAWSAGLKADRKRFREVIAVLPRLIPEIRTEADRISFTVEPPGEDFALGCRFRKDSTTSEDHWLRTVHRNGGGCWISTRSMPPPFQYQLGLIHLETSLQMWEPWVTMSP
jgi:hypothetical protein